MPPYWGATTSASQVWSYWVSDITSLNTTTASADRAWYQWTDLSAGLTSATGTTTIQTIPNGGRAETSQEREARIQRERERVAQRAAEEVARKEAASKARELLVSTLDRKQKRELEKDGHFHVHTKNGVRTYRIKPGSPPVRIKSDDGYSYSYCIHPVESFPACDVALTLKLLLETDEEEFLRIANAKMLYKVA